MTAKERANAIVPMRAGETLVFDFDELRAKIEAAITDAVAEKEAEYAKVRKDQDHREAMMDFEVAEAVKAAKENP